MTTATVVPVAAERIAEQRSDLEQQRAELVARRPAVALAAASGDAMALEEARTISSTLADLAVQLDGLVMAEAEVRRQETVKKQEAAAAAIVERAERAADVRAHLVAALAALDVALVDLEARCGRIDQLARDLDQLEVRPGVPPQRRAFLARRIRARVAGALRCWPISGPSDTRPLGDADVP